MHPQFHVIREQRNTLSVGETRDAHVMFHFHSQIEICLITEGEVEVWINDNRKVLKAGGLSVALSHDAHRYQSVSSSRSIYLIIPTNLCSEFLSVFQDRQIRNPFLQDRQLFDLLLSCYDQLNANPNEITARGYVYVILGALLDRLETEPRSAPIDPSFSTKILLYISQNFREDLSLASIAAAMGYNPSYLSRAFKNCFQIGLSRYITMVRLREAVQLMKESNKSVLACALESGFRSSRTFYRAFCEEFHCTPKEYLSST